MAGMAGWEDNRALVEDLHVWTDWYTDTLFAGPCQPANKVIAIAFPYSRFYIDAERLVNDELEQRGQGIIYTQFNGNKRIVSTEEHHRLMGLYYAHINNICRHLTPHTLLIDCHSFPSVLSDVDVCIGYNEDWSRPHDDTIYAIKHIFENDGLKVGINTPYANSISPVCGFEYKSLMIEVNKRCYMNEADLSLTTGFKQLASSLSQIYKTVLNKQLSTL